MMSYYCLLSDCHFQKLLFGGKDTNLKHSYCSPLSFEKSSNYPLIYQMIEKKDTLVKDTLKCFQCCMHRNFEIEYN